MESYAPWEPEQVYAKGDRVVHDDQLFLAAEPVTGTEPSMTNSVDGWPWLWLGRYERL